MATDYPISVTIRRIEMRPMFRNSMFGFSFRAREGGVYETFTGDTFDVWLTHTTTLARVTLTEADATLSESGQRVTFSKPSSWTNTNLPEGDYDVIVFRNSTQYLHGNLLVVTPIGGDGNP